MTDFKALAKAIEHKKMSRTPKEKAVAKKAHKKRLKEMSESARLDRHAKKTLKADEQEMVQVFTVEDVKDQDDALQRDVEIMAARAMAGESITHE